MNLTERLTELGFEQETGGTWTKESENSSIYVSVLDDGKIEIVKAPTNEDIPAIVTTWSCKCEAMLHTIEEWS